MPPNILAITLARGGSKGIPKKNLAKIGGKPLIQYTFDIISAINNLHSYILSTDCPDIAEYAVNQGIHVPFLRPSHLASDHATSADALKHATLFMENFFSIKYDYVVELMCTNPFKTAIHVNQVIDKIIATKADSVIGVSRLEEHHPARIKRIVDDHLLDFVVPELSSRRQDLTPEAYIRNGSIYAINRDKLILENYRFGGPNSRPYIMPEPCSINIDSPLDLVIANHLLSH